MSLVSDWRATSGIVVLAAIAGIVSSLALRQREPDPASSEITSGDSLKGHVPLLTWSEVHVSFKYASQVKEGDDVRIIAAAEALGSGQLFIESASPNVKIYPAPLVLDLSDQLIEEGVLVVSEIKPGIREIVLTAKYMPQPPPGDRVHNNSPAPEATPVGTWPIRFRVVPATTFGLTEAQPKAVQVLSGVIGLPALVATFLGFFSKKPSEAVEKR